MDLQDKTHGRCTSVLSFRPQGRTAPRWLAAAALLALAADAGAATYRYSQSSNRIYVEGGGVGTLSALKAAVPIAPVDLIDPTNKVWYLSANLIVQQGTTLQLHGAAAAGDVNELRLQSNNSTDPGSVVYIMADHGGLSLDSTKVISWDANAGTPDMEHANFQRAFVRVRSRLAADGVTPLESRMDIVNSEVAYLGYNDSEAYGLSWKVLGDTPGLFDQVQVRGNVINSNVHHNYFGIYTYGLQDGSWINNHVHHNVQYGFDAHDDSDNLVIEDNDVHDNGNHGIILSKRCDHAVIRNNRSSENAENGIMLHRTSSDALIEGNVANDNADSGVSIYASHNNVVRDNVLLGNLNTGIRLSNGAADNLVEANEMGGGSTYGIYLYKGTDAPEPGDNGRPKRNTFKQNIVHDITSDGIKMSDGEGNNFIGNRFTNIGGIFLFSLSRNTLMSGNFLPAGKTVRLIGSSAIANNLTVKLQKTTVLSMDGFSSAVFSAVSRAIFDVPQPVPTVAAPKSSKLTLTTAALGTPNTTVNMRNMTATPSAGTVNVNPTMWETTGALRKTWVATVSDAAIGVAYVVGDLAPSTAYQVRRGGALVGTFTSSAVGKISFSNAPGVTTAQTYEVTPQP